MMDNNFTDSLSTVIFTLAAFEDMCALRLPRTRVIYDQQLSYETAIEALLDKNHMNQLADKEKPDNLLIYQRTVLEDSLEGAASRVKLQTASIKVDDEILKLKPVSAEFDLNFLYTAHQIEDIYKFETYYAAKNGFGDKELTTKLADLGNFTHYLRYLSLTDIQKSSGSADVSYKMVGGTIRVRGVFFVLTGSTKAVAKFRLRLFDKREPLADSILINQWTKP